MYPVSGWVFAKAHRYPMDWFALFSPIVLTLDKKASHLPCRQRPGDDETRAQNTKGAGSNMIRLPFVYSIGHLQYPSLANETT